MTDQVSAAIIRSNPPALGVPPGCSRVVEVRGGRSIFIAGPTALDRNGEVVGKGNFARQAARVFENLAIALQSAGCTAANLIKLTGSCATWMISQRTEKRGIDFCHRRPAELPPP